MEVATVEGITDPVDRELQRLLRRAVVEHVATERRRVFAPLLHIGTPGGREAVFAATGEDAMLLDHGLRTDVVAALLHRECRSTAAPLVWLTRPGELVLQDVDAAWLSAARAATAEAGVPLTMVVVTRQGWWDPRSGARRTWHRLRP